MGSKFATTFEYNFKAHTDHDAKTWHDIIAEKATGTSSVPTSPVESREASGQQHPPTPMEEKEAAQAKEMGQTSPTATGGAGQQSGVTGGNSNTTTGTVGAGETSPIASGSEATHFYGAPAETVLGDRQYVQK